jgi:sec-independent protein translocase protein TatC
MPLFDHLGELRMRLVRIVVCLLIAACVFYMATPTLAQFLLQPVQEYMPHDANGNVVLNVFGAFDAFSVRFGISMWSAVVACMPVIIWQLLAFFLPALKPNERKWFLPTFFIACGLFITGTVFCYNVIIKFEIGFGFAFELPLVVFYLVIFEVVPYAKLRSLWREVYVGLMVLSAFITPDASPVTMFLLFGAMIALYEISLLAARLVMGNKIKKQKEEAERQAKEDAEWEAEWAERQRQRKLEDSEDD